MYGTDKNYIIVEAELKDGAQDPEEAAVNRPYKPEDPKTLPLNKEVKNGANKYTYYVCHEGYYC